MLDKLLEIGSWFDWISPALAQVQDIANGPSHTFLIPQASGWSGREISRMLREHGVKHWGMMIVNHTLMLSVRQKQARWADYLLQRSGIPLLNPISSSQPATAGARPSAEGGPERQPARRRGLFEELNGLLDSMAKTLGL